MGGGDERATGLGRLSLSARAVAEPPLPPPAALLLQSPPPLLLRWHTTGRERESAQGSAGSPKRRRGAEAAGRVPPYGRRHAGRWLPRLGQWAGLRLRERQR